jgi:hypothetical protein
MVVVQTREQEAADRLRQALDLFAAGESLMRARLRREHSAADEAEIERLLVEWLGTRPGAEYGDSSGRPRPVDTILG